VRERERGGGEKSQIIEIAGEYITLHKNTEFVINSFNIFS
jgi:hypothetical protein